MKFSEFLAGRCHSEAKIKIIWPERNKIATGQPGEFKNEMSIMNANVFDFLIQPTANTDYDVMVWLTKTDQTMI